MPFIAIKGVYPSILFTFVICYSIINGKREAIGLGILSGLLQDIYFAQGFGYNAFTNLILCYIAAIIGENIFKHKKLIPVLSVCGITIAKFILIFIVTYIVNININFDLRVLVMGIYNMIVAFFMYNWVYNMSNKNYMKSQWKFNK
jgi:rod shape-determining protein MreD